MKNILFEIVLLHLFLAATECKDTSCLLDIRFYEAKNETQRRCLLDIICDKELSADVRIEDKTFQVVLGSVNTTLTEINKNLHLSCQPLPDRNIFIAVNAVGINLTTFSIPLTWSQVHEVNVSRNNLTEIKDQSFGAATDITVVDLSYNEIGLLWKRAFVNYAGEHIQIEMLLLQNNNLRELHDIELSLEKRIKFLDISCNRFETLSWLEKSSFAHLTNIKADNNRITSLSLHFHLMTSLSKLSLVGNSINFISDTAFSYLNALQVLDLSKNNIETLQPETFEGLHSLMYLNMSHNKIDAITEEYFIGSPMLTVLDLSHNNIGQFRLTEGRSFAPIDHLLLTDNNLSEEEIYDVLKLPLKVHQIHVGGNKFNCRQLIYRQAREMVHKNLKTHPAEKNEDVEIDCSTGGRTEMFGVSPRQQVVRKERSFVPNFKHEEDFNFLKQLLINEYSALVEIRFHRRKENELKETFFNDIVSPAESHLSVGTVAWASSVAVFVLIAISIGYLTWKRYPNSIYSWRSLRS